MIAVVLEMSGIPSLAFAVGVYLPLSSSTPIFIGGLVRWLIDHYLRQKHSQANLSADELRAEGDKSPGVLLASGYIAGGAIGGIVYAVLTGAFPSINRSLESWAEAGNPFFHGPWADALSLVPFAALVLVLYLAVAASSSGQNQQRTVNRPSQIPNIRRFIMQYITKFPGSPETEACQRGLASGEASFQKDKGGMMLSLADGRFGYLSLPSSAACDQQMGIDADQRAN